MMERASRRAPSGVESRLVTMRKPIALVCLAALLIAVLALPLAGLGLATLDADSWAPARVVASLAPAAPRVANPAHGAAPALHPRRGPPSLARFLDPVSEESPWEEAWCARAGWRGSSSV